MPFCNKKVFLTGGTGLIGKEVATCLLAEGFDVYALTIECENPENGVHWVKADLFDFEAIKRALTEIEPEYLLNFAWCASGDYLTSPLNEKFKQAGLDLLKAFHSVGGRRAVYVGTCFEYGFRNEPLKETDPTNPQTRYAQCKNDLRISAQTYAEENGISFGWGRIFYVYGENEHPKRLTAAIINSLRADQTVTIKTAHLKKDYMYTKDIAGAFVAFLKSDVTGIVNICTGQAVSIGDFAKTIAQTMGKENLLDLRQEQSDQPPVIVGDNTRLEREVGYQTKYTLQKAVKEILQ